MKKAYSTIATAGCLLALSIPCGASQGEVSLGVKGGTLGIGLEAGLDVNEFIELRGGINYATFDFDATISQGDYTFEPTFHTLSLLLDLHPFGNAFRFTGGMYLNNNEMDVNGTYRQDLIPKELVSYMDLINQVNLKGTVEFETFAPYLGIGWTSNHYSRSGWGVNMDLGVMFQGSPEVTDLHVEDPWGIGSTAVAAKFMAQEKQAIQDEIEDYEYYPVLSISVSYRF